MPMDSVFIVALKSAIPPTNSDNATHLKQQCRGESRIFAGKALQRVFQELVSHRFRSLEPL